MFIFVIVIINNYCIYHMTLYNMVYCYIALLYCIVSPKKKYKNYNCVWEMYILYCVVANFRGATFFRICNSSNSAEIVFANAVNAIPNVHNYAKICMCQGCMEGDDR